MLTIDGNLGEGGGQILRTSLSLAAVSGRSFRLERIRAGRSRPGLRPQHLTAVHAAAALCGADLEGAEIDSQTLLFQPQHPPAGGTYRLNVNEFAPHGSAGAVTLIVQTILWPLLFAREAAVVSLQGGTHVPFSPSFHYLQNVSAPSFRRMGAAFELELIEWGWMPKGNGQIKLSVTPVDQLHAIDLVSENSQDVHGLAVVTNLPGHIPHRMARRVDNLLEEANLKAQVPPKRLRSHSPGAGTFLWLPSGQGGSSALGAKGIPAQSVAEAAVAELLSFVRSGAAIDAHLADQLLLPLALATGRSTFTTAELTEHTRTNASLLRQWLAAEISIHGQLGEPATISVDGIGFKMTS